MLLHLDWIVFWSQGDTGYVFFLWRVSFSKFFDFWRTTVVESVHDSGVNQCIRMIFYGGKIQLKMEKNSREMQFKNTEKYSWIKIKRISVKISGQSLCVTVRKINACGEYPKCHPRHNRSMTIGLFQFWNKLETSRVGLKLWNAPESTMEIRGLSF